MTFEAWLAEQLPGLLRFAQVVCGGPDPAEEVVQDVAVKVHARWARIRDLEHREAYVRRMVVNEHLSWRRKWSRIIPQAEFREPPPAGPGFADQHADRAELVGELAKLPRKQRAALALRYFDGLPDDAIADLLGCRPVTVRSHISRGLATLRVEMQSPALLVDDSQEGSHAH